MNDVRDQDRRDDAETAIDCIDNAIKCGVENWSEVERAIATLRAFVAGAPTGKLWQIPNFGDQIRANIEAKDFKTWFIFIAMSHMPADDFLKKFFGKDGSMPGEIEVELRVNGQLTNTEDVFKLIEESFEGIVLAKAVKLLEAKFGRVGYALEAAERELKIAVRQEYPDARFDY